MPYLKVFAIRKNIGKTIHYVNDPEKVADDREMVNSTYVSALNCQNADVAYEAMMETKQRWNKEDGVQGYHLIQSFAPGEGTAESVHQIGLQLAEELFGDGFEAIICTHLNKGHLHNHIVVNSVSFVDGHKYHYNQKEYYEVMRRTSDRIAKDYDLSVIKPDGKGKSYTEWDAENHGKPTIRSQIREDLDRMIAQSYTMNMFWDNMRKAGYQVKNASKSKYASIMPPGGQRAIRLKSLGEVYTEEAIRKRIEAGRNRKLYLQEKNPSRRYYRIKGRKTYPKRKITGFEALYFRYVYLLRARKPNKTKALTVEQKKEVIKLQQYTEQFVFLHRNQIQTVEQLDEKRSCLRDQKDALMQERAGLYRERRKPDKTDDEELSGRIHEITNELKQIRKELRMCSNILAGESFIKLQLEEARNAINREPIREVPRRER